MRAEQGRLAGNPAAARALAIAVDARSNDDSLRESARAILESL
jgi:hypothetical protein